MNNGEGESLDYETLDVLNKYLIILKILNDSVEVLITKEIYARLITNDDYAKKTNSYVSAGCKALKTINLIERRSRAGRGNAVENRITEKGRQILDDMNNGLFIIPPDYLATSRSGRKTNEMLEGRAIERRLKHSQKLLIILHNAPQNNNVGPFPLLQSILSLKNWNHPYNLNQVFARFIALCSESPENKAIVSHLGSYQFNQDFLIMKRTLSDIEKKIFEQLNEIVIKFSELLDTYFRGTASLDGSLESELLKEIQPKKKDKIVKMLEENEIYQWHKNNSIEALKNNAGGPCLIGCFLIGEAMKSMCDNELLMLKSEILESVLMRIAGSRDDLILIQYPEQVRKFFELVVIRFSTWLGKVESLLNLFDNPQFTGTPSKTTREMKNKVMSHIYSLVWDILIRRAQPIHDQYLRICESIDQLSQFDKEIQNLMLQVEHGIPLRGECHLCSTMN